MSSDARQRLCSLKDELASLEPWPWNNIAAWSAKATPVIRSDWPNHFDDFGKAIARPRFTMAASALYGGRSEEDALNQDHANKLRSQQAKERIVGFLQGLLTAMGHSAPSPLQTLQKLLDRFHIVARQLTQRHANRPAFEINDEYDVQDLLHALLKLTFDDIRPEEWTPSYAGSCARMDFLLKQEEMVIEVKKTNESLGAAKVGEQLLVDIAKYSAHPDCNLLVCFVYDPEHKIGNPSGLKRDLEAQSTERLQVVVCIRPV